jgi:hypothetical protein
LTSSREEWRRLLDIVAWLQRHPRPGVYLRQVDIPGVHSKFIEAQRGVLGELLELALPPAAIDSAAAGVSQFARRYGFRDKPQRIRFRLLDRRHALLRTSSIGALPGSTRKSNVCSSPRTRSTSSLSRRCRTA